MSVPIMGKDGVWGGMALQPVRLVLLLLVGPREGENDFLEFPSIEEAVVYARELYGERRFQLEGIEDKSGRSLVCYDELHDRCRAPDRIPQRRFG
ncbi:MAG TPA: hypothetical protein VFR60_04000 [Sphingomicrobium sp.]|nr:hypothetical protein [Sphingomicrobium sp.]